MLLFIVSTDKHLDGLVIVIDWLLLLLDVGTWLITSDSSQFPLFWHWIPWHWLVPVGPDWFWLLLLLFPLLLGQLLSIVSDGYLFLHWVPNCQLLTVVDYLVITLGPGQYWPANNRPICYYPMPATQQLPPPIPNPLNDDPRAGIDDTYWLIVLMDLLPTTPEPHWYLVTLGLIVTLRPIDDIVVDDWIDQWWTLTLNQDSSSELYYNCYCWRRTIITPCWFIVIPQWWLNDTLPQFQTWLENLCRHYCPLMTLNLPPGWCVKHGTCAFEQLTGQYQLYFVAHYPHLIIDSLQPHHNYYFYLLLLFLLVTWRWILWQTAVVWWDVINTDSDLTTVGETLRPYRVNLAILLLFYAGFPDVVTPIGHYSPCIEERTEPRPQVSYYCYSQASQLVVSIIITVTV